MTAPTVCRNTVGCGCEACIEARAVNERLSQPWRTYYDEQPWLYATHARTDSIRLVVPVLTMVAAPVHTVPLGYALWNLGVEREPTLWDKTR